MSRKGVVLTLIVVGVFVLLPSLVACAPAPPQIVRETVVVAGTPQVVKETVVVAGTPQVVRQTVVIAGTPQVIEKVVTSTPPPKAGGLGVIGPAYTFQEGTLLLTPQPDLVAQFKLKPDYKAAKPYKIAYITKHLLNPYFVSTDQGLQKRCKEMGVQCTTYAPQNPDNPAEQINMIEDAVNKGVDAIVVYAVDSKAVTPALQKAEAKNIPIVGLGTVPFGAKLVTFISADYYTRSYDIAKLLADKKGGKGLFVTIDGVPGAQNAKDMKSGYLDALNKYPNIQVLASQTGYWKRPEGMKAMENLLQRYPQIDAVVAADDESGLGAVQALEAAKFDLKNTLVVGFNATHDALCAIQDGRMYATDDADPGGLSAAGVEVAVRHLQDKENFAPELPWPLPGKKFYVTPENLKEFWPRAYSLSTEEKAAGKCIVSK